MDIVSELGKYKTKVDSELETFFDNKLESSDGLDNPYTTMISFLKEYTLRGGKRIRPAFVYYGYLLFADETDEAPEDYLNTVIKASMAPELKQTYYLIHDDITDKSDQRRGGPSMHKMFEACYLENGISSDEAKHHGIAMALFAGDLANTYASNVITQTNLSSDTKTEIQTILDNTDENTLQGQVLDIQSGITSEMLTEKELLNIHLLKSAKYTIESPLSIGAILAGATEEEQNTLSDYANPLGIAFQLQDDILGVFGDDEKVGKPTTSDLAEGKKTLLIIKALEGAKKPEQNTIMKYLGNPNITSDNMDELKEIMIDTGSLEYSKNLAETLIEESKQALGSLQQVNPVADEFLNGFADYMLTRKY